jgi:hypothetical protein
VYKRTSPAEVPLQRGPGLGRSDTRLAESTHRRRQKRACSCCHELTDEQRPKEFSYILKTGLVYRGDCKLSLSTICQKLWMNAGGFTADCSLGGSSPARSDYTLLQLCWGNSTASYMQTHAVCPSRDIYRSISRMPRCHNQVAVHCRERSSFRAGEAI